MRHLENKTTNILVVDDDEFFLKTLEAFMGVFRYKCFVAVNGLDAIEQIKKRQIDIVITDIQMPQMNGLELLSYIQGNCHQIDVIVMTGYTDETNYVAVVKAGATDFINKPFTKDELEAKLHRIIREQNMRKKLEEFVWYDSLTGLYNRRFFDLKLHEEVKRAHRQKHDLLLALFDVDNFKEVNDSLGHLAGDHLLKTLGEIFNDSCRHGIDFPFRYGGDEFAIIVTSTKCQNAMTMLNRIVDNFSQKNFVDTSLSIGMSNYIHNKKTNWVENTVNLIAQTDKALYTAKAKGKNRIELNIN